MASLYVVVRLMIYLNLAHIKFLNLHENMDHVFIQLAFEKMNALVL